MERELLQTILAKLSTLEQAVERVERHLLGPPRQDLGRAAAARERQRFLQGQRPRPPPAPFVYPQVDLQTAVFVHNDVYPVEYVFDRPPAESDPPPNGLPQEWLNQLFTCTIAHLDPSVCLEKTGLSVDQLKETNCSICLDEGMEEICILPCKHVFHKECIEDWLKRRPTCPTCRFSFTTPVET